MARCHLRLLFQTARRRKGSYYYKCGKSSAQGWSLRHFIHLQGRHINLKLIFKCQDSACVHVEGGEWEYDKHKRKITQQRPTLSSRIIRSHSAGSHDWWQGRMFSSLRTNYQTVPRQRWSSTFPVIQPRLLRSGVKGISFFHAGKYMLKPARRLSKGNSHINGCRWAAQLCYFLWFQFSIQGLNSYYDNVRVFFTFDFLFLKIYFVQIRFVSFMCCSNGNLVAAGAGPWKHGTHKGAFSNNR